MLTLHPGPSEPDLKPSWEQHNFCCFQRGVQSNNSLLKYDPGILHISANQCMEETGRDLWRSPSPTPLTKQGQYSRLLRAVFSLVLNISMGGGSAASLGNLFFCLTGWAGFLIFKWNFLYFGLCPLPLVLHQAPLKRIWLCLPYTLPPGTRTHYYIY